MTMAEVTELCTYWREHPPAHVLIAGYVGYKSTEVLSRPEELFRLLGADLQKGGTMRILH